MAIDENAHLDDETIKQFARFDSGLVRCISAIYDKDVAKLQSAAEDLSAIFLANNEATIEFMFWLISQYAVTFQELINTTGYDIKQVLMERELFALHALENPAVFDQTFGTQDEEAGDVEAQTE